MGQFQLASGLRLLVRAVPLARLAAVQAWVEAGATHEPEGQGGLAHACQHLIAAALASRAAALGAQASAWTTADHSVFQLLLPSRFLDEGIDLLADVLAHPPLDEEALKRERPALLAALQQAEESPLRAATEALFRTAFLRHPYRRPVSGTRLSMLQLRPADLLALHARRYRARHTTLVVVGDVVLAEARAWVARAFTGYPTHGEEAAWPAEPPQREPRIIVAERDGNEAQLLLGFRTVSARSPHVAVLELAAVLLGHGPEARLAVEVQRNRQAASSVFAHSYTPRDPGMLLVGVSAPQGLLGVAARATLAEVLRLGREPVSPEELRRARMAIETDSVRRQETTAGAARRLGFFESSAGGLEAEARYWQGLREAMPDSVRQVLAGYLRPENLTIAVLQPRPVASIPSGRGRRARLLLEAVEPRDPGQTERLLRALLEQEAPPGLPSPPVADSGDLVEHRLRSGGRLLILPEHSTPLVALQVAWPGGQRIEEERSAGASHLLGQLLCRGTRSRSAEQIARDLESMGARLTALADANSLGLRVDVLSANWERALALLADCLRFPSLEEEELERARRQVLERLHARASSGAHQALRTLLRALLPGHPYRFDVLGTPESVAVLSRRRLLEFYRRHYPLARLTLAVVGDAAPAQVLGRVEALLPPEPEAPPPAPLPPPSSPPPAEATQIFQHTTEQQGHLVLGLPGAALDDPDRPALALLRELLDVEQGRLAALRGRCGLLHDIGLEALDGVDPGYLAIRLSTSPAGLEAAQAAVRDELRRLVDHPVGIEELDRARRRLVARHEAALQGRGQLAAALAFGEVTGLGPLWHRLWPEAILGLEAADVQRAARRFFDERRLIQAALLPDRPAGLGGRRRPVQEARRR